MATTNMSMDEMSKIYRDMLDGQVRAQKEIRPNGIWMDSAVMGTQPAVGKNIEYNARVARISNGWLVELVNRSGAVGELVYCEKPEDIGPAIVGRMTTERLVPEDKQNGGTDSVAGVSAAQSYATVGTTTTSAPAYPHKYY